jgi:hypothetical protein
MDLSNHSGLKKIRQLINQEDGDTYLDIEDIVSVILTFPAALVAAADGIVDETERLFLMNLCEELGDGDASESPLERLKAAERYRIFMQLLFLDTEKQSSILELVNEFCRYNPDSLNQIKESMLGIANASNGVSAEETQEIARIFNILTKTN